MNITRSAAPTNAKVLGSGTACTLSTPNTAAITSPSTDGELESRMRSWPVKFVNRLSKVVLGEPTAVKLAALNGKKARCQLESAGREKAKVVEYPTGRLMKKARRI